MNRETAILCFKVSAVVGAFWSAFLIGLLASSWSPFAAVFVPALAFFVYSYFYEFD